MSEDGPPADECSVQICWKGTPNLLLNLVYGWLLVVRACTRGGEISGFVDLVLEIGEESWSSSQMFSEIHFSSK